jgi:LTXXQ motif family protein
VRKTLLATALAAGAAIAVPVGSSFAQNAASQAAAPSAAGSGEMPGMHGGMGGMMGGGPMMMHRMWIHRMRGTPSERCIDRLAWRAARRAFIETKLDLTAAQRPLWDKVESAAQAEQQKERQLCDALKSAPATTFAERMQRLQRFLQARLDGLKAAQPAVEALYQALTAAQRAILDHPFGRS